MKIWRLAALVGLSLLTLFAAAPASAEWRRAESPNFIVYSSGSEARLHERVLQPLASHPHGETLAQEARQLLERARAEPHGRARPHPRQDPAPPATDR